MHSDSADSGVSRRYGKPGKSRGITTKFIQVLGTTAVAMVKDFRHILATFPEVVLAANAQLNLAGLEETREMQQVCLDIYPLPQKIKQQSTYNLLNKGLYSVDCLSGFSGTPLYLLLSGAVIYSTKQSIRALMPMAAQHE